MRISLSNFTNELSLRQMAAISIAGGLLAAGSFVIFIPVPRHNHFFWLTLAASLVSIVLGYLISFGASSDIESGIANERWPQEDVLWIRAITHSPYLALVSGILLIAGVLSLVFSADRHHHGVFWPFLILIQTLTQLATVTKEPCTERTMELAPRAFTPLSSNHWGQPKP